jgi:hypothetical protein
MTALTMPVNAPLKWDPADGPCPWCKQLAEGKLIPDPDGRRPHLRTCDDCGKSVGELPVLGHVGYESATVGHYHLDSLGARAVWNPIMRELCADCFRTDYFVQFPDALNDPVTSLPRS